MKRNELLFVVAITVIAAWIRAPGLGKWCLAIDEFYLSQSVTFILDNGLPRFPDGGYYVRGIGLQYLTTIPMILMKNREFAVRLLPLTFGILSIPLFYLLSRKFLSPAAAAVCSFLLLISSWHIEFSRFARMYAPFQFFLFLFIYFLYSGYFENKEKAKKGAWIVAFLSILFYEGSIFLPLFLVFVIAARDQGDMKHRMFQAGGILLLLTANFIAHGPSYNHIGVFNPLPPEATTGLYPSSSNLPIHLPDVTLFFAIWKSPYYYIPFLVLSFIGATGIFMFTAKKWIKKESAFVLAVFFAFALTHQLGLILLTAFIVFIFRKNCLSDIRDAYRNIAYFFLVFFIFWVGIAYLSGYIERIKGLLVGYPALKYKIYLPFARVLPIWSLILALVLLYSMGKGIFSKNSRTIDPVLAILVLSLSLVAVLQTPVYIQTTRYCFPFFPLLFLVGMFELESWQVRSTGSWSLPIRKYALMTIPIIFMSITEDYHIGQILDVSSKETNFRMGEYARYAAHWYRRADTRTPTIFVDNAYKNGDVVVLDDPPMSAYLSKPYINYINIADVRIPYESRDGGRKEMWTGKPLIYKEEQLAEAVPENSENSLWLIAVRQDYIDTSFSTHNPPESLGKKFALDVELRHIGVDGRIGAWEIRRRGYGKGNGTAFHSEMSYPVGNEKSLGRKKN